MKRGSINRRTVAQFILVAWAGSLGWLARREFGKGEAATVAEATIRLHPEANFFAVTAGGRQVGYASITVDTLPTGFRLTEVLALDVPERDSTRRVTRRTDVMLSRSLRVRTFARTITGGGLFEEFSGSIEGDTLLRMALRDSRDQTPETWTVPLSGDVVLPEVLPYRLAFGQRLEVGRTVAANVLDLMTGTVERVEFAATAESTFVIADSAIEQRGSRRWRPVGYDTVPAWKIEYSAGAGPVVSWVDRNGGLVAIEAALGVRLERSAFELVSINYRTTLEERGPGGHGTVPGMRSLVEAGVSPDSSRVSTFVIESASVERFLLPRIAWMRGGRQSTSGDRLQIGALSSQTRRDSAKSDFLDPAPSMRPPAPAVAEFAKRRLVPGATARQTVERLVALVAATVRLDPSADAPILAPRVLAERRGGAEGRCALFVELAHAAGIPARQVSGAAVIRGTVYAHAWAEALIDGEWLAVDPAFGRVPASASLIRMSIGGGGRAIDLVPLMGSASFTHTTATADQ